jgi:hypothetical protein
VGVTWRGCHAAAVLVDVFEDAAFFVDVFFVLVLFATDAAAFGFGVVAFGFGVVADCGSASDPAQIAIRNKKSPFLMLLKKGGEIQKDGAP